ncbi:Hypothetical predicted protein [Octopus vulgaris]|uniref:Secreted protein n=1 Tax=Octopus vulgaris TaxID=6645 RepID=A0AA36EYA8_OCTVU|nr:Hypothetical predicted protein [Octopus vulgaris]
MATNWLCLICWTAVSLTVTLNIVCLAQWNSVFARSSLSAAGARSRAGVSRPASDREKNNLRQQAMPEDNGLRNAVPKPFKRISRHVILGAQKLNVKSQNKD